MILKFLIYPSDFKTLATFIFSFELGILTTSWEALRAFLIRVNISAIGSVIVIICAVPHYDLFGKWFVHPNRKKDVGYQLDFTTPGISPLEAIVLKQIRQIPNFLKYARLLPQIGHLLY